MTSSRLPTLLIALAVVLLLVYSSVFVVNAKEQAKKRGIVVEHVSQTARTHWPESIVVSVTTRGRDHEIEGTVFADGRPRVLAIDGYRMELVPENTIALIFNDDRPGVIGLVGQTFGNAGINIASFALGRNDTNQAIGAVTVDETAPIPAVVLDELRKVDAVLDARIVRI